MNNSIIDAINQENVKTSIPEFNVGDTVKVMVKVIEGDRERLQAFEGIVIARKHGGISETFTVRRISFGVGVEKTFPIHSPKVADIQVVRHGKVRRAKLYYLRDKIGKDAKVKTRVGAKVSAEIAARNARAAEAAAANEAAAKAAAASTEA